jgi:threonine dehydrogenase-like Zn-dependent dehydrogenase
MFRKLFDTATVQTAELDQIANLMIFKRHLDASKSAKANGKNYNEGIVVGAGPIGLYTDFQLFMAGMRIFLVNNRPER